MVRQLLARLGIGVLLAALWSALVFINALNGWTRAPLAPEEDTAAFVIDAKAYLAERSNGNVAFLLLEDGKPAASHFLSIDRPVDGDSVFQVASLSKWVTAHGVMILVEDGLLELDRPVSDYLTRWQLPDSEYDNDLVTVRRLLSHTAGLTDGLGYGGFAPEEPLQSLEGSLTRAADASPHADGRTRVGRAPGRWDYSGGGFTILQLLIEEVTGQRFEAFMDARLFQPLGMTHSSFDVEAAT